MATKFNQGSGYNCVFAVYWIYHLKYILSKEKTHKHWLGHINYVTDNILIGNKKYTIQPIYQHHPMRNSS